MNINEMTAQDCADWLRKRDGITMQACDDDPRHVYWADATGKRVDDPYKLTLDSAAAALREPWEWEMVELWTAHVDAIVRNINTGKKVGMEAPDELTARYRAVVAVRMEDAQ